MFDDILGFSVLIDGFKTCLYCKPKICTESSAFQRYYLKKKNFGEESCILKLNDCGENCGIHEEIECYGVL